MTEEKRNIFHSIDSLVDKDGLKTDVKITMTDETLLKIVAGLLVAGGGIVLIAHVLKNIIANKHLEKNTRILEQIKQLLTTK